MKRATISLIAAAFGALTAIEAQAAFAFFDGNFATASAGSQVFTAGTTANGQWIRTGATLASGGNPDAFLNNNANNSSTWYGFDVSSLTGTETWNVSVDLKLDVTQSYNTAFGVAFFGLTSGQYLYNGNTNATYPGHLFELRNYLASNTAPVQAVPLNSSNTSMRAAWTDLGGTTGPDVTVGGWVTMTDSFPVNYDLYDVIVLGFYSNGSNGSGDVRGLDNVSIVVPEPTHLALIGGSMALLAARRRRQTV